MIPTAVLARYARSLADVVFEMHLESEVGRELELYREIFRAVPEVLDVFHSPAVARDAKEKVLGELLSRYPAGKVTANFLHILLENNRIRYFHEILDLYIRTLNERRGIVAATVISAAPLSQNDVAALRESLTRATGRTVTLDVHTDAELLGGLVVQIGSTVYDGSVRRQLDQMRRRLMDSSFEN